MKPLNSIEKIIAKISDANNAKALKPRNTVQFRQAGKPVCILIHSGIAYLCRREDRMVLALCEGPLIVGLRNIFNEKEEIEDVYLLALSDVRYEVIDVDKVRRVVENNNLWREIAELMMYSSGMMLQNLRRYAGRKSCELINNALLNLMQQPAEFRARQNVAEYIQDRTMLSRSLIMGALGTLKRLGHIEVKRGVLEDVKSLPSSY